MSATHFSGPIRAGTRQAGETNGPNLGNVVLYQSGSIVANGTNPVSASFDIPPGSIINDFTIDVRDAFNSATSADLTIGMTAGNNEFAGRVFEIGTAIDVRSIGRKSITYAASQLFAMNELPLTNKMPVVFTVIPVGATTQGFIYVSVSYVQR